MATSLKQITQLRSGGRKSVCCRRIDARDGVGIYAKTVMRLLPNLPVEEEERLSDPQLRDNFIERIFVYRRWQDLLEQGITASRLIDFHTRHKLTVLSRGQRGYLRLDQLIANTSRDTIPDMVDQFITELMTILKRPATRRGHNNV